MITPENNIENSTYISLKDIADRLGTKPQYIYRFLDPNNEFYFKDIKTEGDPESYRTLKIHPADVESFIKKYLEHKEQEIQLFKKELENQS